MRETTFILYFAKIFYTMPIQQQYTTTGTGQKQYTETHLIQMI